jgi:hypothetical protein
MTLIVANRGTAWRMPHQWGTQDIQQKFIELMLQDHSRSVRDIYTDHYKDNPLSMGIAESTLEGWWTVFQKYGSTPIEWQKLKVALTKKYGATRQRKIATPAIVDAIKVIIEVHPEYYLDEIQQALFIQGGRTWLISRSTIWRVLVEDLKWSYRLYQIISKQRDEQRREEYRQELGEIDDPTMFVFLDESQWNRSDRRRRSWAPRGRDNRMTEYLFGGRSYMLLAACDINGMVLEMCDVVPSKRSSRDKCPYRGTVDTDRFKLYLREMVIPHLGNYVRGEPHSVVVFDNAPVHTHSTIREMIEQAGARLIMCAPYSPDLNPIEPTFHQYKSYLRRHWHAGADPGQLHLDALLSISPNNMLAYYRSVDCILNLAPSDEDTSLCSTAALCVVAAANMMLSRKRARSL